MSTPMFKIDLILSGPKGEEEKEEKTEKIPVTFLKFLDNLYGLLFY
jgi:hypothetical protein